MKKVLIPLDYDPTVQKIAKTGYELAKEMHVQSILLHVIPDAVYNSTPNYSSIMRFENFDDVVETNTAEELKNVAQKYLGKLKLHLMGDMIQRIV
jgi:hypothetical protein